MSNLLTLAKYPFLSESKSYVQNDALSISELLDDPVYERARINAKVIKLDEYINFLNFNLDDIDLKLKESYYDLICLKLPHIRQDMINYGKNLLNKTFNQSKIVLKKNGLLVILTSNYQPNLLNSKSFQH